MLVYTYDKKNISDLHFDAFFLNKLIPEPQDQKITVMTLLLKNVVTGKR